MIFEAYNAETIQGFEYRLTIALKDLSSVFDVTAVKCEAAGFDEGSDKPGLLVTVNGEHKNGSVATLCIYLNESVQP
jgi:hypothetical protein